MGYASGLQPHIRAAETVRSLTWTRVCAILPAAVAQLFFFPSEGLFLAALLGAAFFHAEISYRITREPASGKYDLKNGTAFLYALVFFLAAPELPPVSGAVIFIAGLFLARTVTGGQGSTVFHPAAAALLFWKLLFQMPDAGAEPLAGLTAWIEPAFLLAGGLYLGVCRNIRMEIPAVFMAAAAAGVWILKLPAGADMVSLWLLAAFFILTDSETMPLRTSRRMIAALAAAIVALFFEKQGAGAMVAGPAAILSANALTPWLDEASGFARGRAND